MGEQERSEELEVFEMGAVSEETKGVYGPAWEGFIPLQPL
jgi:hypothetical protein